MSTKQTQAAVGSRRFKRRFRHGVEKISPALFLLPGALVFLLFILIPIGQSIWISFFRWDGLGPMSWVGLGNYQELLNDPQFFTSLKNNVIWLLLFLLAPAIGLVLALLVNQPLKGMKIAKSLFYMPLVLAPVTVAVVFTWFYDPTFGLLAVVMGFFGGTAPAVLSDPNLVTFGIVIAAVWPQTAMCMVLYLAALNGVNDDQIGAGRIDGAQGFTLFWHVVLPQLRGATFIAFAVSVVGALRSFDHVAVMTKGGPFGSSSVLAYQMYEQTVFNYRLGYGAAIAVVLFVVVAIFIAWYLSKILGEEAV